MMAFLDTNILIRYFTRDNQQKAQRCDHLLEEARKGRVFLLLTHLAIAEVVWILSKSYQIPRETIAESFRKLLSTPNIHCDEAILIMAALDLFESKSTSFIDAYHATLLPERGITELYSYDTDFDQVPELTRREP